MDEQYMKMRNIATSVAYSPNVTEFLNESSDERVIHMENIEDIFLNSYLLDSDIAGIYLYDTDMERLQAMELILRSCLQKIRSLQKRWNTARPVILKIQIYHII